MSAELSHDIADPAANRRAGLTAGAERFRKHLVLEHPAVEVAAIGDIFFVTTGKGDAVMGFDDPDTMCSHLRERGVDDADIRRALARPAGGPTQPGAVRET